MLRYTKTDEIGYFRMCTGARKQLRDFVEGSRIRHDSAESCGGETHSSTLSALPGGVMA